MTVLRKRKAETKGGVGVGEGHYSYAKCATFKSTIILFACPPKFCVSIVFIFPWDHCKSQEKMETMSMQNLGGQTKSIMVFLKVAY